MRLRVTCGVPQGPKPKMHRMTPLQRPAGLVCRTVTRSAAVNRSSMSTNGHANGKKRPPPTNGFKKGKSGYPQGRTPGIPNKTTQVLKDAILIAASNVGDKLALELMEKAREDGIEIGTLNGGLVGYLEIAAMNEMKSFLPLLGKVLPLVVKADVDVTLLDRAQREAEHFTRQLQRLSGRIEH